MTENKRAWSRNPLGHLLHIGKLLKYALISHITQKCALYFKVFAPREKHKSCYKINL